MKPSEASGMRCFVIQPFDGGVFDRRFVDIYKPAIEEAGFEPYRVDHDPSVSIPIQEIEKAIKSADVCFAEITLDNPNVWFELGYSIAVDRDLCLVCSDERNSKYPFDVQHRNIIKYDTKSSSDFVNLHKKIVERLRALVGRKENIAKSLDLGPLAPVEGLSEIEVAVLCAILQNQEAPDGFAYPFPVAQDIERMGYNRLAQNLGSVKLLKKNYIKTSEIDTQYNSEPVTVLAITDLGMQWFLENEGKLNFQRERNTSDIDDAIPF